MSTATSWSITTELCEMSGEPSLLSACRRLGLVGNMALSADIEEIRPWFHSGSETYSYVFRVHGEHSFDGALILKAMVAATPGVPPEVQLRKRLSRRSRLAQFGCSVPVLFGVGAGVYLEAHAGSDLIALIEAAPLADELQASLAAMVSCVADAGFSPISIIPNIVVSDSTVNWVDFGSDLGDPLMAQATSNLATMLLREYSSRSSFPLGPGSPILLGAFVPSPGSPAS